MFSIVRYMIVFHPSPAITVKTLWHGCHDNHGPAGASRQGKGRNKVAGSSETGGILHSFSTMLCGSQPTSTSLHGWSPFGALKYDPR